MGCRVRQPFLIGIILSFKIQQWYFHVLFTLHDVDYLFNSLFFYSFVSNKVLLRCREIA
jgi:hypothetical protein